MNRWLAVAALGLLGLNAGLALAHVLEMPSKLELDGPTWLVVQGRLYEGWGARIGQLEVVLGVVLATLLLRTRGAVRRWFLIAATLVLVAEAVVFPLWVLPTNAALDAWNGGPPPIDWEALRRRWEGGHAGRFALLCLAWLAAARPLVIPPGVDGR